MTTAIDITKEQRKTLLTLLHRFIPGVAVWAYGSRVKWTARPNSDLDLVAFTTPEQQPLVSELKEALAESNLPFLVDFHVWDEVPERFHEIIRKEYVVLQEARQPVSSSGMTSEWKTIALGDLCEFRAGTVFKPVFQGQTSGSYPFVKVSDMNIPANMVRIQDANNWVSEQDISALRAKPFPVGTVVFAKIGEALRQNRLRQVARETIIDNNMMGAIPRADHIEPRFFYYALSKFDFSDIAQGTALPFLTISTLSRLTLDVPPLHEQKTIAHILGTLDDRIELNRQMNATLEAMARALFQSWFVDFDPVRAKLDSPSPASGRGDWGEATLGMTPEIAALFPSHFQDSPLGHIPRGWTVGKIQDCCTQIQNGGTPRRNEPRYWDGGNIPWLASGEVRQSIITATESFITEAGLKESSAKWVPARSTVIALYGATAGQVSFVSSPLTTNQAVCALIPKESFEFFNYLTMLNATTELESKAVGSAQQNISKGIVEETQVILPPTPIVEQFTTLVEPCFDRWVANLHQSRTLATLRDALLPKLLSGELSVDNFEQMAEEVI